MTRGTACTVLEGVLVAVAGYALVLVAAGRPVNRAFDTLGFGGSLATAPDDLAAHVVLVQGVLGAVMFGWAVLLLAVVRIGVRGGDPRWWWAVSASLVAWFVVDTGFSLAVGSWQHAAFNVPFAVALAFPLAVVRPEDPYGRRGAPPPLLSR